MTVESDIQFLIQLAQKDLEMKENRRLLETTPLTIRNLEQEVSDMDAHYTAAEAELEKFKKEKIRLEGDVKDERAAIVKKQIEQMAAKDNKEYAAKTSEIQFLEKKIDQHESRILELLDLMESERKEVEAATEKINTERDAKLNAKKDWENKIGAAKAALAKLEDDKALTLPLLSARIRNRYERILKVKGDSGVVNLIGSICQGCFTRVPPQQVYEVRRNDSILTCEACGRIMIYFPVDDGPDSI
jgi:predicted  nucleic acid-binding Zn-ribbon protein